jgi:hypothetical protein
MSDETQSETETPKRSPGRPRGSTSKHKPMHRGRLDPRRPRAPPVKVISYTPYEPKSSTNIPTEIVQEIWDYYDGHLQWCVFEAGGKPTPEWISARQKNGFVDCRRGDFDGLLDFLAGPDGRMVTGGLVLMCRDRRYQEAALAYQARQADTPKVELRHAHAEQGVDVSMPGGGSHPSARAQNRHKTSYEPVKIPE